MARKSKTSKSDRFLKGEPILVGNNNTQIDFHMIADLVAVAATVEEIAIKLKISETALKDNAHEAIKYGKNDLVLTCKRMLFDHAKAGSLPALAMLMKLLIPKQMNSHLYDDESGKKLQPFQSVNLTPEQLLELGKRLRDPKQD
jgi:hypothetical protein